MDFLTWFFRWLLRRLLGSLSPDSRFVHARHFVLTRSMAIVAYRDCGYDEKDDDYEDVIEQALRIHKETARHVRRSLWYWAIGRRAASREPLAIGRPSDG